MSDLQVDVLAIDEWAAGRELLGSVLRRSGYSAEVAIDGADAVGKLKARRPQVLLIDYAVASRDDWQVIRRLRAVSDLTFIMVMGSDEEPIRIQALNRGADDYIIKPLHGPRIAAHVGATLRMLRRIGEPRADEVYDDGLVELHVGLRRVSVAGCEVELTPLEFRLLTALV